MAIIKSAVKSVDGGKFQVVVEYSYTTSQIKFKPYIKITDDFKKNHVMQMSWRDHKGKLHKKRTKRGEKNKGTFYPAGKGFHSNKDYSCTITGKVAGVAVDVTITATYRPPTPKLSVKRVNDAHFDITVTGSGYKAAAPVTSVVIERISQSWTGSWEEVATRGLNTTGGYRFTISDQNTARGNRYAWRVRATNQYGTSGNAATGWMYTMPPDISNVAHTRKSNNYNLISWTRSVADKDLSLITWYRFERSENGGAWTTIWPSVEDNANSETVYAHDKTCQPNSYYKYRVKPCNSLAISPMSYPDDNGTDATYNTPAAPERVTAVFQADGSVLLTIDNRARTATAMYVERSDDGGKSWTAFESVDETNGVVTSYTDTSAIITGTSPKYRVRNYREGMEENEAYSAYTYSNSIIVLSKPLKPTTILPVQGTAIMMSAGTVRLAWVHNPQDGTDQEAAVIKYKLEDEASWKTVNVGALSYYDLDLTDTYFSAGKKVLWNVSTKGAHASYSDESDTANFAIYEKPSIKVTAPENGTAITNLPISMKYFYDDTSGTLDTLTLNIIKDDEIKQNYLIASGQQSGEYAYELKDYLFDNGETYALQLIALSTTGLQDDTTIGITVEYVSVRLKNGLLPDADFDDDTGYTTITINADVSDASEESDDGTLVVESAVKAAYLYRVVDDTRVLVAAEISDGDQILDKFAPANKDFSYQLVMVAESGQIAIANAAYNFDTLYWFCYWAGGNIARARWNPKKSVKLNRPEKTQVRYSGREYAVSYDSAAMEETCDFTTVLTDQADLDQFIKLMRSGGRGVWKSFDGSVYNADFEFSYEADYTETTKKWDCTLNVTRIEGEALDGELVR